uniref:NADH-ubiquinone oxidoreductase chain 4 n=1 Tax=Blastocladiella emersonii TaxID=4808 RepID=B6A7S7_BLAEM|nr:NADH dehydrogenase subunit 4 [Blastocladiella emersonii]ABB78018.1 NADH dehydrogenase subunit 4 [Blastocladiella emersonii]
MLTFLIVLPLIGAFIIYLGESIFSNVTRMKIALLTAGINFIVSIGLWIQFDENTAQFQFVEDWGSLFNGGLCHLILGVDGISLFFVILTTFLTIPILLTPPYKGESPIAYLIAILILESMLIAVFVVLDLLLFYICFETVLIPMFLIIGIWGSRERKILAAYQFFLYTLLGSLFMLLGILIIYYQTGTTDYQYLLGSVISEKIVFTRENLLWVTFFLSFAVKVPMVPVHIWLPEAHTEAPTGGSMLLAGILLKLSGYGFIRYSLVLFPNANTNFTPFVITLATIGIIYSSLACLRQIDIKKIVAYSSISHMNTAILGIFSNTVIGIEGSIFMMLGHGIVSTALFFCVGLIYDRTGTRILKYYRGLSVTMPLFALFFFILGLSNMAVPGTVGFVGEFLSLYGIFKSNILIAIVASLSIILGAAYNIWLTNRLLFGQVSKFIDSYNDLTRREFVILFTFAFLSILFGLFPNIILEVLHLSVSSVINPEVYC